MKNWPFYLNNLTLDLTCPPCWKVWIGWQLPFLTVVEGDSWCVWTCVGCINWTESRLGTSTVWFCCLAALLSISYHKENVHILLVQVLLRKINLSDSFESFSTWAETSKSQSQLKCFSLFLTRRCSSGTGVLYFAVRDHHIFHCFCFHHLLLLSRLSIDNIVPWHCYLWLYLSERNHRSLLFSPSVSSSTWTEMYFLALSLLILRPWLLLPLLSSLLTPAPSLLATLPVE